MQAALSGIFGCRRVAAAGGLALCLALAGRPALAQSPIGFVKTVLPEAEVIVDGSPVRATTGMPLQTGFRVRTGPKGSLGVTLRDNTVLSFGPNTEFYVAEYLYAPAKGELKLVGTMLRGTLHYVSGIIAKLQPEAVSINVPLGTVGLRGTRVLLMVDDE